MSVLPSGELPPSVCRGPQAPPCACSLSLSSCSFSFSNFSSFKSSQSCPCIEEMMIYLVVQLINILPLSVNNVGYKSEAGGAPSTGGGAVALLGSVSPPLLSSPRLPPASVLQLQGKPCDGSSRKAALTSASAAVTRGRSAAEVLPDRHASPSVGPALWLSRRDSGPAPQLWSFLPPTERLRHTLTRQRQPSQQPGGPNPCQQRGASGPAALRDWAGVGGVRKGKRKRHRLPFCWGLQPLADFHSDWTISASGWFFCVIFV